jgi:hypothetical protein
MNILSVDFDIIMAPSINLYNSLVKDGVNFSDIQDDYPLLSYVQADYTLYQKLVNYILDTVKNLPITSIRVARSHEDIKYILNDCENAHVYNIDHHHDLGYPTENPVDNDYLDCSNWADYFIKRGNIVQYVWLKNKNSIDHPFYNVTSFNFNTLNLRALPPMDKVFICLSPEWIPKNIYPLFYMILDIISKDKGIMLEVH